jgi:hypothetical protein
VLGISSQRRCSVCGWSRTTASDGAFTQDGGGRRRISGRRRPRTRPDPGEGALAPAPAELRRKGTDLDSIHDEARRLGDPGHDAYLLYFEAARQGMARRH